MTRLQTKVRASVDEWVRKNKEKAEKYAAKPGLSS